MFDMTFLFHFDILYALRGEWYTYIIYCILIVIHSHIVTTIINAQGKQNDKRII